MGLFDFLKKKQPDRKDIQGPTYLEGFTEKVSAKDVLKHEWRGKLKSLSGQTWFRIKYYGKLHSEIKGLIMGTNSAPILVYAVDPDNGQEILIFDGCKYGYDALFCDTYTEKQINRLANKNYAVEGDGLFEIVISIYNGAYFDNEFAEQVDEDGFIELADGTKQTLDFVNRNAFDTLQVYAVNKKGESFNIISEELA